MIIKQIAPPEAKLVLCHPEIYETISDDNSPPASEFNPPDNCEYIGGFVDGDLIGVMIYHTYKESIKCHVQVLPTHRADHAREFGTKALGLKRGLTIYADIPEIYPNVLKFAQSFGFKIIDTLIKSGVKNGKSFNSKLLILEGI